MARTAIVTGASRGIGRVIANRLAKDGFAVLVNYVGSSAKAQEVVNEILKDGGNATAVQADVSKPEDVQNLFAATKEQYGRIGVVVNNAGILGLSPIAKGHVAHPRRTHKQQLKLSPSQTDRTGVTNFLF